MSFSLDNAQIRVYTPIMEQETLHIAHDILAEIEQSWRKAQEELPAHLGPSQQRAVCTDLQNLAAQVP